MRATALARVDGVLDAVYLGSTLRAWITAGVIFVVVLAVLVLVRRLLIRRLETTAPRTSTRLDDLALGALRRTRIAFLALVALAAAGEGMPNLPGRIGHYVDIVARLALYVQLVSWGNGAVAFWIAGARADRAAHDKPALTSINLLGVVARVTLWVLLILLALDAMGVNVTALITGLGVAGVAVALAVQSTLGDLLASLSIALDKPFVVGDYIAVDQYQGTVENVGLKTTRIRALSGEQIVIANAELLKARIRNYQRQVERRVAFQISLDPGTTPTAMAKVPPILRDIITPIPQTRFDRSHFSTITDSALVVETVYFVTSADYTLYMNIQQQINLGVLEHLRGAGLQLAFSGRETVVLNADGRSPFAAVPATATSTDGTPAIPGTPAAPPTRT